MSEGLAVQGVENGVSSSVGGSSASVSLTTLAVLQGLSTECSLVDLALLRAGERYSEMFKLNDGAVWSVSTGNQKSSEPLTLALLCTCSE